MAVNQIVVGVSATSGSPLALRFAAEEARLREVPLVAVQAWRAPRPPASPGGHPPGVTVNAEAAFAQASQALRKHVAEVLGAETVVSCKLVRGTPGGVLLKESAEAALLVMGAPRNFAVSQAPLLAHKLTYNAACPVVIMPPAQQPAPRPSRDTALKRGGKRLAASAAKAAATAGRPGIRFGPVTAEEPDRAEEP